jgi:LuxR family transcriptional regulator, quorum-sensing system regulator BjaR1
MDSALRNQILDAFVEVSRPTSLWQILETLSRTAEKLGFTSVGINGLPPPGAGADPVILTERTPEGFRDLYIAERFYLVDHICARARATYHPFRFSEAPYRRAQASRHERFMQALKTFEMGRGLIVPFGRPTNIPACVWLSGGNPDLDEDAKTAIEFISLFAAHKAHALWHPSPVEALASPLTHGERDVLKWIAAGKTSWEISIIAGVSERAINKIIADGMAKLDAVTRTQAVVNAIRLGEIAL